jgi:hypothetical protein
LEMERRKGRFENAEDDMEALEHKKKGDARK